MLFVFVAHHHQDPADHVINHIKRRRRRRSVLLRAQLQVQCLGRASAYSWAFARGALLVSVGLLTWHSALRYMRGGTHDYSR